MKKVLVIVISFISIISVKAIDINSKSGIVYNLNDDIIIYEKDINDKLPIASLTKIMTAIIVIENTNLDDNVKINYQAFNGLDGYALAGFKAGDKVTIRDLLYGLMLPSGAECGNALAITVSGSYDEFVDLMNSKVAELQLENTHFDNVIGMDSNNNYSFIFDSYAGLDDSYVEARYGEDKDTVELVRNYLDTGIEVDLIPLKRWTNCNTREDFRKIVSFWGMK